MGRPSKYSPELRERAVRMVQEHAAAHASQWAAIRSVGEILGCSLEPPLKTICGFLRPGKSGLSQSLDDTTVQRLPDSTTACAQSQRQNEMAQRAAVPESEHSHFRCGHGCQTALGRANTSSSQRIPEKASLPRPASPCRCPVVAHRCAETALLRPLRSLIDAKRDGGTAGGLDHRCSFVDRLGPPSTATACP